MSSVHPPVSDHPANLCAMFISIPAFLSYLFLIGSACAQINVNVPNCTYENLTWSFNSLQQSPCLVGASLEAVCYTGGSVLTIPPISNNGFYSGGNGTDGDNPCICNSVVYSLMSACSACQQGSWTYYVAWLTNCSSADGGDFPKPVPDGIRVPRWAYITSFMSSESDSWDPTAAEFVGDTPEVIGGTTITSTLQSTLSPTASGSGSSSTLSHTASGSSSSPTLSHTASGSSSSPTLSHTASGSGSSPTSHTSSNRSGMEGGVIGGVIGGTLISGVAVWFLRRRRAQSTTDTRGETEQPVPYPLTIKTPKLYDPSDPTTYPRRELQPQRFGFTSHLQPNQIEYSGLPEV